MLRGPLAEQIWSVSLQADRWLDERSRLLVALRTAPRGAPSLAAPIRPVVPASAAPVLVGAPPVPSTGPGQARTDAPGMHTWNPPQPIPSRPQLPAGRPSQPPVDPQPGPPASRALSVQTLLVGLGALLLAVASVVFLAFSWDRLGITGRSVVVALLTVGVLGGAVLARRARMGATAEAVGSFGVVLVLLDAAAVRATGLAGEQWGALVYAATAGLVCAGVLGGVGVAGRLRSATVAASALLPVAPVLLGIHFAMRAKDPVDAATWVAACLLTAALTGIPAGLLARGGRQVEQGVLRWAAAGTTALAVITTLLIAVVDPGRGAPLSAGVALVALAHTLAPDRARLTAWSAVAGGGAALALALMAVDVLDAWALLGAPMLVGLLALASRTAAQTSSRSAGPDLLFVARSALVLLAPAALPAAILALLHLLTPLAVVSTPWSAGISTQWGTVGPSWWAQDGSFAPDQRTASFVALLVVAGVLGGWARIGGSRRAWTAGATVLGVLMVCLPWQPQLPVLQVVLTAAGLAVAAVVLGHRLQAARWLAPGTILLVAGCTVGGMAVTSAWVSRPLSLPGTVLGIAALVLARRATGWWGLTVPAAVAGLVTLGGAAAWAGTSVLDAVLLAGLAGSALVMAAGTVDRIRVAERRAIALTGAAALGVAGCATGLAQPLTGAGTERMLWVWAAAVLAAGLVVLDPRRNWPRLDRQVAAPTLVLATVLLVWQGVTDAALVTVSLDRVLAAALVSALALAVAASLHRSGSPLATGVEVAAAVCASAAVVAALPWSKGSAATPAWPVLVVVAAGAAVLCLSPGRRWVAWVAWALASATLWERLWAVDPAAGWVVVEAFSLPPALLLLAAGAWHAHRDGVVLRPSVLAGTLGVVLPSAVAAASGPVWRPVAVLLLAATAVAVAHRAHGAHDQRAARRDELVGLLLGAAVLGVVLGPLLRALRGQELVESWSLPAALVLAGAGVVALRRLPLGRTGPAWALVPALLVAVLPTLLVGSAGLAGADGTGGIFGWDEGGVLLVRHLAVVVVAGSVLAWSVRCAQDRPLGPLAWTAVAALTAGLLLGLVRPSSGPVEALSVPAGLFVLATGLLRMSRLPALGSWPWLGPGLAVALLPSLALAVGEGSVPRTVPLAVAAAAAVVVGVTRGWQAPVLEGAGVLVVHALVQLAPWLGAAYDVVPRWATLALIGSLLLGVGARYEARVRDVVTLRRRVAALR